GAGSRREGLAGDRHPMASMEGWLLRTGLGVDCHYRQGHQSRSEQRPEAFQDHPCIPHTVVPRYFSGRLNHGTRGPGGGWRVLRPSFRDRIWVPDPRSRSQNVDGAPLPNTLIRQTSGTSRRVVVNQVLMALVAVAGALAIAAASLWIRGRPRVS